MSDLQLPDRLAQLRTRWEADPASRIFLQLAEEYRHVGRLHEALAVLEAGLSEHPGYLSALVAKGRCLLELSQPEPAREVLERVVRQDATQAVANKLLVRAYLDTGQAERARERLDLYSLLHDGDPEIEDLRGRIRRLDGAALPAKPEAPRAAQPPARPPAAVAAAPVADDPFGDDPFSLPPPAAAPVPFEDVFQLDAPPVPRRAAVEDVFELDYPMTTVAEPEPEIPAAAAPEASESFDEPEPTEEGEPFPGLVSRAIRHRYLTGLAAEGLFPMALELAPAPPPAAAPQPFAPEPAPGEIFELRSIGAAVEAELRSAPAPEPAEPADDIFDLDLAPEPEPIPAPAAEVSEAAATVTLGDLYLRQGHVGEAEQIFQEVLRREPDNAAAREALAQVASSREEPATASAAPAAMPAAPGDRRARKVQLLTSYLQRIRRGSQPDVP
jgi:tetratricopeptide (TPR) repeat protein